MNLINKRKIGTEGEMIASDFLKRNGLDILERNYRNRYGEIDLIAKDRDTLVFTEVKFRKDELAGHPIEAVNVGKQRVIRNVAKHFMYNKGYDDDTYCRFDVIGIIANGEDEPDITWVRDAF